MRRIEIADGLSVRFPRRSDDFVESVEIGLLAAALAVSPVSHAMELSPVTVAQATAFARSLGYRVVAGTEDEGRVSVTFLRPDARPQFRLIAAVRS
jgi:hypothetical protein